MYLGLKLSATGVNGPHMADEPDDPTLPDTVPSSFAETLDDLDDDQLRQTAEYVQSLMSRSQPVSDEIEAAPGEEIVRITEHDTYTGVVKREPCAEGCEQCPHGPYLYTVRRERSPHGEDALHWTYVGRVEVE